MRQAMENELTALRKRINDAELLALAHGVQPPEITDENGHYEGAKVIKELVTFLNLVGDGFEAQSPERTRDALQGLVWCALDVSAQINATHPPATEEKATVPSPTTAPLPPYDQDAPEPSDDPEDEQAIFGEQPDNPTPPITIVREDPTIAYYAFATAALALVVALVNAYTEVL